MAELGYRRSSETGSVAARAGRYLRARAAGLPEGVRPERLNLALLADAFRLVSCQSEPGVIGIEGAGRKDGRFWVSLEGSGERVDVPMPVLTSRRPEQMAVELRAAIESAVTGRAALLEEILKSAQGVMANLREEGVLATTNHWDVGPLGDYTVRLEKTPPRHSSGREEEEAGGAQLAISFASPAPGGIAGTLHVSLARDSEGCPLMPDVQELRRRITLGLRPVVLTRREGAGLMNPGWAGVLATLAVRRAQQLDFGRADGRDPDRLSIAELHILMRHGAPIGEDLSAERAVRSLSYFNQALVDPVQLTAEAWAVLFAELAALGREEPYVADTRQSESIAALLRDDPQASQTLREMARLLREGAPVLTPMAIPIDRGSASMRLPPIPIDEFEPTVDGLSPFGASGEANRFTLALEADGHRLRFLPIADGLEGVLGATDGNGATTFQIPSASGLPLRMTGFRWIETTAERLLPNPEQVRQLMPPGQRFRVLAIRTPVFESPTYVVTRPDGPLLVIGQEEIVVADPTMAGHPIQERRGAENPVEAGSPLLEPAFELLRAELEANLGEQQIRSIEPVDGDWAVRVTLERTSNEIVVPLPRLTGRQPERVAAQLSEVVGPPVAQRLAQLERVREEASEILTRMVEQEALVRASRLDEARRIDRAAVELGFYRDETRLGLRFRLADTGGEVGSSMILHSDETGAPVFDAEEFRAHVQRKLRPVILEPLPGQELKPTPLSDSLWRVGERRSQPLDFRPHEGRAPDRLTWTEVDEEVLRSGRTDRIGELIDLNNRVISPVLFTAEALARMLFELAEPKTGGGAEAARLQERLVASVRQGDPDASTILREVALMLRGWPNTNALADDIEAQIGDS